MPTVTPSDLTTPIQVGPAPATTRQQDKVEQPTQTSAVDTAAQPVDPLAPKLAALAKKEQALRAQVRALQEKEESLKTYQAEVESAKAWKDKIKTDPWSVMIEAGLSPEQATQIILNQPKPEDIQYTQIQKELQALKQAQLDAQKQAQDAQTRQYEQAKTQIGNEVKALVKTDPTFETVKAMQAEDSVVELIEAVFNDEGYLMPIDEATQLVEDYLVEEAVKYASLQKVQAKLKPAQTAQTEQKTPPVQSTQKTPSTLTHKTVQANTVSSSKDRRARAIAAFMGQKLD